MNVFAPRHRTARYLLIAAAPTPNGPLHLGHLAGPYLRLDVLARHLRSRGDEAWLMAGTDPYESYVELVAEREGRTPESVARTYSHRIADDLAAARIDMTRFVDPLAKEWNGRYVAFVTGVLEDLVQAGICDTRVERVLYSRTRGRHLVGCWLAGQCPVCGAGMRGFFCEDCGGHFRPESVVAPAGALDDGDLEWRSIESRYARLPDAGILRARLERMGLAPEIRAIVDRYLEREGPAIRLTHPGSWGMPWRDPGHVVFSYAALYAHALFCGEVWGQCMGRGTNAFAMDSDVITVRSFGVDGAVPILVGVLGLALAHGRFRPFDHVLPNYFYNLEAEKFSTSRGHVVRVRELLDTQKITSDALRYHLALTNPERAVTSLHIRDLVDTVTGDLVRGLELRVRTALARLPAGVAPAPAPDVLSALENLVLEQDRHLGLTSFSLAGATHPIGAWVDIGHGYVSTPGRAYWWLKGLALLSAPVMPDLGEALWHRLGHTGVPVLRRFLEARASAPAVRVPWCPPLTEAALAPCLPPTLRPARSVG